VVHLKISAAVIGKGRVKEKKEERKGKPKKIAWANVKED
jgi:hypothetical protein